MADPWRIHTASQLPTIRVKSVDMRFFTSGTPAPLKQIGEGFLWVTMGYCGLLWVTMGHYGLLWVYYGFTMGLLSALVLSFYGGYCGLLWLSMAGVVFVDSEKPTFAKQQATRSS